MQHAAERDIIALSSLLTTSLPFVKDVLARLDAAGERSSGLRWSQAAH